MGPSGIDPSGRSLTRLRVAIVGTGRVGLSLALALQRAGFTTCSVYDVSAQAAARAATLLALEPSPDLEALLKARPDVIFLTVPDSLVDSVARNLAQAFASLAHKASTPSVAHTSGVTPVAALDPCLQAGAVTFGFHPLQTFAEPETGSTHFAGATIAVSPGDRGGWELGAGLALALGAHPVRLADENRALYHAAACVASNYLVTLEHVAERMFIHAGLPPAAALSAFLPLVRGAVDNLAAHGTVGALTGPLSRGDIGTIERHLAALRKHMPDLEPLYRALGLATLELVEARGLLSADTLQALQATLSGPAGHTGGADGSSTLAIATDAPLLESSPHPPDTGESHE